jgi:hypothetical protein
MSPFQNTLRVRSDLTVKSPEGLNTPKTTTKGKTMTEIKRKPICDHPRSQRKMKRGKGLDEIVADAARQETEGSELSPEEWERIIAGARRYDEPLEEVSPELWRMVEQYHRYATDTPQNASKTKTQKGDETTMTAAARIRTQATNANQKTSLNC